MNQNTDIDDRPSFYASNRKKWRNWLAKNGSKEQSIWLIIYRKESETPSVYYEDAVEEALCFGWIDSKSNKRDAESFYLFMSKRNPKSKWSKLNKHRVEKLMENKAMAPEGIAMVEEAKRSGTWNALDEVEALILPPDLIKALKRNKSAFNNFAAFPPSVKRGILEWISNAKREETRQKRIDETARLAKDNIRANQYQK